MATKKRNRGKRHKNVDVNGHYHAPSGTGKRNRKSRGCTHMNYKTGEHCGRRVSVLREERALCEEHRHRHTAARKTNALISRNQEYRFNHRWGGISLTAKNQQQWPLIVIEGLDGVGKSTQVKALAATLNALVIQSPPFIDDPIHPGTDLRVRMDGSSPSARREYYRSSNFFASEHAKFHLKHGPVILDRYWPSTASFSVLDKQPPEWEHLGTWPAGMIVPDVVILLTVDEENRLKRIGNRGIPTTDEEEKLAEKQEHRAKVLACIRFFDPIEIDTSNKNAEEVLDEIMMWLQHATLVERGTSMESTCN